MSKNPEIKQIENQKFTNEEQKIINKLNSGTINVENFGQAVGLLKLEKKLDSVNDKEAINNLNKSVLLYFKKFIKNAKTPEEVKLAKSIKDYLKELNKLHENLDNHTKKLIREVRKELYNLPVYKSVNLEKILLTNDKDQQYEVGFDRKFKKFFEIKSEKNKVELVSISDMLPLNLDIDIDKKDPEDKDDDFDNYDFWITTKSNKWVNVYKKIIW